MLPLAIGVCILAFIFLLVFLIKNGYFGEGKDHFGHPSEIGKNAGDTFSISSDDIILAELTEKGKDSDYAILWNAVPGKTYKYEIKDTEKNTIIAQGHLTSSTGVFKMKGLPLEHGSTYRVSVGEKDGKTPSTAVDVPFVPLSYNLQSLDFHDTHIDCDTDATPTNIEIVVTDRRGGNPIPKIIPLSKIQLKIEPPGFICDSDVFSGLDGDITIMIYNGRNTANILTLSNYGAQSSGSGSGETQLNF